MSLSDNRKLYIRDQISEVGVVQVTDLAINLKVSEMTIRRDLSDLERVGILKRTHGGAVSEVGRSFEPPFNLRKNVNQKEKQLIAAQAATHVKEGDTIAIDSGSTAMELAKLLYEFKNLTIVSPSLHIAVYFLDHPTIKQIISGGWVRKDEGSLVGDITRKTFENLYFDKFFMSTGALSESAGFTEFTVEDADIKQTIMAHSKKTFALIDSSKFGRTAFSQVTPCKDIDILITDKEPEQELKKIFTDSNVRIEIVSNIGD